MASEELQEELEGLSCTELIKKLSVLFDGEQEDAVDDCLDWFLFTYSPEYAFPLVQNNADAFREGLFLEIIMSKIREIYEPEIFLESLNILSSMEAYEQDIAKAGAVRAVIMMMGRDLHNERSQILGCKIMANLAHDLEVCKFVGKVKGISRLIEILKRHSNLPDVIVESCRAIANLAFRCKQNKEILHMEGALNVLLNTMNNDKKNERVVNAVLRAIRNIVSDTEDFQLDENLLKNVLEAMTEFPQCLDIQTNCIWILVNLMSGKVNIKKTIVDHGGLDHIITAMEHYDMDPHIQLAGSTAIAILSKLTVYRQMIPKKGGLQLLLAALRIHRQIVPIQRSVLKAIYRLSFNEQNRTKLAELRIVTEVIESMKVNNQSGPLLRMAILCLLKLTKNNKLKEIIQAKAVPLIVQARNTFSDIPHIHSVASMAVEALVSGAPPTTNTNAAPKVKDMESLRTEVKQLQNREAEKDGTLASLQQVVQTLEIEVAKLKVGIDIEVLNEMVKKINCKREISSLKHQKVILSKELKKIQIDIDEFKEDSLREEDKKAKKQQQPPPPPPLKTSENLIEKKSDKKESPLESKRDPNQPEKKKGGSKNPLKKLPTKEKVVTAGKRKLSREKKPSKKNAVHDHENVEGSIEEETVASNSNKVIAHDNNLLRSRSRKSQYGPVATQEDIDELIKQIEELQSILSVKEQELAVILVEKSKVDTVVNKLNMDVRATHVLIESLQKESLYHTQNREKMVTGNSLFAKHQKKLKAMKDEMSTLNEENEELKKEIIALGGDLSSLTNHNKKKKKIL